MTADRFDKGKPQLHYVDTFDEALDGVAKVSEYGASKYAPYNYLKGAKAATESYNCARRHMKAWLNGEDLVQDALAAGFEINHIDAAIWNLLRLRSELVRFPERDDRPCKVLAEKPSDITQHDIDWTNDNYAREGLHLTKLPEVEVEICTDSLDGCALDTDECLDCDTDLKLQGM